MEGGSVGQMMQRSQSSQVASSVSSLVRNVSTRLPALTPRLATIPSMSNMAAMPPPPPGAAKPGDDLMKGRPPAVRTRAVDAE